MQVGSNVAQGGHGSSGKLQFQRELLRKFEAHATHQSLTRHAQASHAVLAVVTWGVWLWVWGSRLGKRSRSSMPRRNRLTIRPSGLAEKHRQPLNSSVSLL